MILIELIKDILDSTIWTTIFIPILYLTHNDQSTDICVHWMNTSAPWMNKCIVLLQIDQFTGTRIEIDKKKFFLGFQWMIVVLLNLIKGLSYATHGGGVREYADYIKDNHLS